MPPEVRPTAVPPPVSTSMPHTSPKWWKASIVLIVVALAVGAFLIMRGQNGEVMVLILNADGTRSVAEYNLDTQALTPRTDINAQEVVTDSHKIFSLSDGSYITLAPAGVVRNIDASGSSQLLIASAVAPILDRTPLAVWHDGARLAWMNPSDNSIQVFGVSSRGSYHPLYLGQNFIVSSMGFVSDDVLIVTRQTLNTTDFYAITVSSGSMTKIASLTGVVSILP